jgi:small subunit ribosomal protein S17
MGKKKEFTGTVISDKMQKTIIVRIMCLTKHPKYKRIIKKYNKFKVHDEKNIAKIGDIVRIEETRPLSKDKRFRLLEVVKKATLPHIEIKEEVK